MSEIRPLLLPQKLLRCHIALILCLLGLALVAAPVVAQGETPQPRAGDTPGTAAGCSELLVNGGFEVEGLGWQPLLPGLPATLEAKYVSSPVFAGSRSMRLGIAEAENTTLTNGIFQVVTLPANANPIALSVQLLPKHESNPGTDLQFIDIHDAFTNDLIVRLWSQTADRANWLFQQFDLTSLRGRTVRISVGVNNDGIGGRTALFVDSMSLQACDTVPAPTPTPTSPVVVPTILVTPTPTPTDIWVIVTQTPTSIVTPIVWTPTPIMWTATPQPPTATSTPILPPTPLPAGCITDVIMNGSFEDDIVGSTGWILGDDPVPPRLVSGGFVGLRALQLGNPPDGGRADVYSYSSARQLITIPHTVKTAELFWSHRSFTQDNGVPNYGNRVDRQELILLSPELVTLERPRYRTLLNTNGWRVERTDLTSYIGKTFYIYFNVLNDGDSLRTWMDLDDVKLTLCFSVTPVPVVSIPADVSPLGTPLIATLTPTSVDGIDVNATRTMIEVTEVSISEQSSERTLEGDILAQATQEQETLTQRFQQIVAQFWWLGVIVVGLWALWGFFGRKP